MRSDVCEFNQVLLVGLKNRVCALPLRQVIETMRPLPVEPLNGLPPFVRGVAMIRGIATPVVDLDIVFGTTSERCERFITMRTGEKQVALCVKSVLGVRDISRITTLQELPPLLQDASQDLVAMIGRLDEKLLVVLRGAWELPEEVWRSLTLEERVS